MCLKLWSRETLRFKGNKTNWFPKGAVNKCFVIYPIQKIAASFSKKVFLLYKLYSYFPLNDIPAINENKKFN